MIDEIDILQYCKSRDFSRNAGKEAHWLFCIIRDIQLMASGNSAESAMDCHRRVRGVIAEQIFDSHGCKIGKND